MFLSPNAVRSRSTAVSTAWVSVPLPGSAPSSSSRDTTAPGWCASARIVAIPAGDSALTTPSTSTQVPRISSTWPATRTVRDCSSGSSSVMWRANAPNRIRSGADVGTPSRTSGRAVTGPTHIACTAVRSADSTWSSMPISVARISTDATAGADVKLTASNFSSAMPATSWSKSPLRGAGCQRYTRIGTTSAPAARSSSRNSGNGSQSSVAPCSCTAMRWPAMPPSTR